MFTVTINHIADLVTNDNKTHHNTRLLTHAASAAKYLDISFNEIIIYFLMSRKLFLCFMFNDVIILRGVCAF